MSSHWKPVDHRVSNSQCPRISFPSFWSKIPKTHSWLFAAYSGPTWSPAAIENDHFWGVIANSDHCYRCSGLIEPDTSVLINKSGHPFIATLWIKWTWHKCQNLFIHKAPRVVNICVRTQRVTYRHLLNAGGRCCNISYTNRHPFSSLCGYAWALWKANHALGSRKSAQQQHYPSKLPHPPLAHEYHAPLII